MNEMAEAYLVKLLYENIDVKPRWVMAGNGRGLGSREQATVFPNRAAANAEAKIWEALSERAFSVVVEPA